MKIETCKLITKLENAVCIEQILEEEEDFENEIIMHAFYAGYTADFIEKHILSKTKIIEDRTHLVAKYYGYKLLGEGKCTKQ